MRITLVLGLCGFLAVTPAISSPTEVKAAGIDALYKISSIEIDGVPIGCVGTTCPTTRTNTPAYSPQTAFSAGLASASEIDTYGQWGPNGYTDLGGCAIVATQLNCWGPNAGGQLGDGSTNDSLTTPVVALDNGSPLVGVTDVATANSHTCVVVSGAVKCVGFGLSGSGSQNGVGYSTTWVTLKASGVAEVVLGGSWDRYSAPSSVICIRTISGTVSCGTFNNTVNWYASRYTNVVDIAVSNESGGGSTLQFCVAGNESACTLYENGVYRDERIVEGVTTSEAVYLQANYMSGLCFYSSGSLLCGSLQGTDYRVKAVAVIAKPLSMFYSQSNSMSKLFFVLPTGLVSVDSWIFSCNGCVTNTAGSLFPVSAFTNSTASQFHFVSAINGATDSPNLVPVSVESGSRSTRTLAPIKVVTESGEVIPNVSIRWTAPDVPGTLGSSATSTLASAADGTARATLATGPVAFTLSATLGTTQLASGASLQAATVTALVGPSGEVVVRVPDAPAISTRVVRVALPDGTPVPNAKVVLRNIFLAYAYRSGTAGSSTWGSQPRDIRGFFGQVGCVYCYANAPSYITGSDGSISFKSFIPNSRSSVYDASIIYDDGDINQTVNYNFTSIDNTVFMPFMATVQLPATDADPATTALDIVTDTSGQASVNFAVKDESNAPVAGFIGTIETVCSDMETGGLVSSSTTISSICGSVSATSLRTRGVSAQGVRKSGCSMTPSVSTSVNGTAIVHFCPSISTKYRIRGQGAIASRVICIRVKGINCGVAQTSTPTTSKVTTKTYPRQRLVPLNSIIKPSKNSILRWTVSGGCSIKGKNLATGSKVKTCILRLQQDVKTKKNGKYTVTTTLKSVKIKVS